ncbi:MAG TPA: glycosyltransferase [Acidimicrobiales bacterium]
MQPRFEQAYMGWEPAPGALAVADHVPSFPAVARFPRRVVTVHFRALADAWAVKRLAPGDVQTARCEHRAGRRARLVLAYSRRVAERLRQPATVVPIGYPAPTARLDPVEAPVAALMADWSWRPNRLSLTWLLDMWPAVRDKVPGSTLLIAGRHLDRSEVGVVPGVEVVGAVSTSSEVLARAAVVVFPCPSSSGPKIKVIEALSYGIPVVTTPAGVEGIFGAPDAGTVVADRHHFVPAVASLLAEPERRAELGSAGRERILHHHAPLVTASARLEAFTQAFGA